MEIFVESPIIAHRREYPGTRPRKSIATRSHQKGYFENTSSTHSGPMDSSSREDKLHQESEQLHSQTIHVVNRTAYSHRKPSLVRSSSYEAHSVALEASLARPRGSREDHTNSSVSPSTPRLVVGREQCTERSTSTPPSARSAAVYRHLKRRLGRTLRGLHCKRRSVNHRKSPPHKLSRIKSSPSGPEELRVSVQGPDCSCGNKQHNGGLLHKQTGRYKVRLSLCVPFYGGFYPGATPEE